MRQWLDSIKPAAPQRIHLLLAAIMWTAVGAMLALFGLRWLLHGDHPLLVWLIIAAIVLGALKAIFVLRHAAARVINRIQMRGDHRCIGGFFSWRTWIAVAVMMGAGWLLRHAGLPPSVLGVIYLAIGAALLIAACLLWRAWWRQPTKAEAASR
jgi:hypothetical protein